MSYEYDPNGGFRQQNKGGKKDDDWFSWILMGFFFLSGLWPVGLFFLFAKLSDGSGKGKRVIDHWTEKIKNEAETKKEDQPARKVTRQLIKTPQYGTRGANAMKIVSIVLMLLGSLLAVNTLFQMPYAGAASDLFYAAGFLAGGGGLLLGSFSMKKRARRFGKYLACAGQKRAIPVEFLARAAGVTVAKAEKDLEIMVEKGLWGETAYVDTGHHMLFLSQEAATAYFKEKEAPAVPREAEQGYSGILRNIRRANDRISDPVLSEKIDRLEELTGKIFRLIEAEPAKRKKADTFMNYYLPTTQKLLDSYADFEEAGVSGENLNEAKARIADTMDQIVKGFEHQLDTLYQAEAMDIDSDIRVMETMLRRDTGSAAKDFGLSGGTAVQEADTEVE